MIKVIALFQKITCLILSMRELLHQLNYQQNQYTLVSPLRFSLRNIKTLTHDTSKLVIFNCFPASGELVCPVLQYP